MGKKVKPVITSARANSCPDCNGTTFEVKTEFGNITQCKKCNCSYYIKDFEEKNRHYNVIEIEGNKIFTLDVIE